MLAHERLQLCPRQQVRAIRVFVLLPAHVERLDRTFSLQSPLPLQFFAERWTKPIPASHEVATPTLCGQ